MGGAGVIDNFLSVFTRYIDSGFGLLGGEVAFIASTLIVIDLTLAALFWSLGADNDIVMRLVRKTLFVGVFAYLISNWNALAKIVFDSFAGLGLKASGTGFTTAELMRPGKVAQTGLDAARPLLQSISDLMGWVAFFENFIQIACLLFAWALVILGFFILAIQLFVTLIEFKLATLAGFVLIPFGLFGKTAFMAERVLGNVVSSGIKVLVLAVIIGIGSTLFGQFTQGFGGETPSIDDAMAVVLAAMSLVGLGIFGPGIANGLVSGGPQLGAGAVAGTGLAVAGAALGAGGAAALGVRAAGATAAGGLNAAGTAAAAAGAVSTAYRLGSMGPAGGSAIAAGLGGVAHAAGTVAASPLRRAADAVASRFSDGVRAGFAASGGSSNAGSVAVAAGADDSLAAAPSAQLREEAPDWARRMKHAQALSHGVSAAAHAVRSGDSHGSGTSVNLSESEGS